ncbi:MAG: hypothetical protein HC908_16235 [Calothrix sp. SM1_7_51]|nr:hypothetical protein [Calothrix sp. SM1_7_51]
MGSFNYTRQLRDLDIQDTTIKTNTTNYQIHLDKLRETNPEKKELEFLEDFHQYARMLSEQIRVDSSYFNTGSSLYAETIAYTRGIAQITQTESDRELGKKESERDRDLRNTIATTGFAISFAQIGISVGKITQEEPPKQTQPLQLTPSIQLILLCSVIFGFFGWSIGKLLTLQFTRDKFNALTQGVVKFLPKSQSDESSKNP